MSFKVSKGGSMKFKTLVIVSIAILTSCASSHIIIGTPRPPINPANVKIYTVPPAKYEQIAIIEASSKSSWAASDQGKIDKVIERLKEEAAALGANGILLQAVGEHSTGAVGTGFANATAVGAGNRVNAFGTGSSFFASVLHKNGQGIAIYVMQDTHEFYSDSLSSSNKTSDIKKPMASLTVDKPPVPSVLMTTQENIPNNKIELSERWEKAGTALNGMQLFIDNNTKSNQSEDIVRVWVKTIANTDNCTDLLEIDCFQLKIRKIDIVKESLAFPEQTNEWKLIIPETAPELIFNSVCLKK
jgi:hypothetical protein